VVSPWSKIELTAKQTFKNAEPNAGVKINWSAPVAKPIESNATASFCAGSERVRAISKRRLLRVNKFNAGALKDENLVRKSIIKNLHNKNFKASSRKLFFKRIYESLAIITET